MNHLQKYILDNNLNTVQMDVHYTLLPGCKETRDCPGHGPEVDELRCMIGDYEVLLTVEQDKTLCAWVLENHENEPT